MSISISTLLAGLLALSGTTQDDPFDPRAHLFGKRPDVGPALGDLAPKVKALFDRPTGSPKASVIAPSAGRPLIVVFGSFT